MPSLNQVPGTTVIVSMIMIISHYVLSDLNIDTIMYCWLQDMISDVVYTNSVTGPHEDKGHRTISAETEQVKMYLNIKSVL